MASSYSTWYSHSYRSYSSYSPTNVPTTGDYLLWWLDIGSSLPGNVRSVPGWSLLGESKFPGSLDRVGPFRRLRRRLKCESVHLSRLVAHVNHSPLQRWHKKPWFPMQNHSLNMLQVLQFERPSWAFWKSQRSNDLTKRLIYKVWLTTSDGYCAYGGKFAFRYYRSTGH